DYYCGSYRSGSTWIF
nr:immunoglobulin light chain junction region [Macaca mulatta]MOX41729.1 immunoglobulin light chain junction region [Macaca mulatta]MOX44811.1 immunoglobulin light chain junction region [Macaca mulatta]MOX46244.1 immunoglobulin light chain junction region [Macaca mulatta]MOX46834.1 immunoglobulin light chain junction region [Macaca mulatta]